MPNSAVFGGQTDAVRYFCFSNQAGTWLSQAQWHGDVLFVATLALVASQSVLSNAALAGPSRAHGMPLAPKRPRATVRLWLVCVFQSPRAAVGLGRKEAGLRGSAGSQDYARQQSWVRWAGPRRLRPYDITKVPKRALPLDQDPTSGSGRENLVCPDEPPRSRWTRAKVCSPALPFPCSFSDVELLGPREAGALPFVSFPRSPPCGPIDGKLHGEAPPRSRPCLAPFRRATTWGAAHQP
ncbi:hypothetical protein LY78DRAFT_60160 [Colletotrichum sublineola]|uniref:Uncharacterized protein n=1 Tax=Colletotrichum sublineola TaxID=1173701 RepID=A0A066X8V9_COLSU|nr:hypothetical protein LY78DRAFT_60160 [Colletotrichum sublineola]KDN65387.1 hypothetical protein CSUB01_05777 [Colletotrichum sublineola]